MLGKAAFRTALILPSLFAMLAISLPASQGANPFDLQPGGATATGYYGVTFEERQATFGENVSLITSNSQRTNSEQVPSAFLCSAMSDPNCSKGSLINAQLVLPPCTFADERMCIEGLTLGTSPTTMESAAFNREDKSLTTPADPKTGLPRGGGPSMWSAPTIAHKGGSKNYGVIVRVAYFQNREQVGSAGKVDAAIQLTQMRVSVFPITPVAGKYYGFESYSTVNSDGGQTVGSRPTGADYADMQECAWTEPGFCAKYADFTDGTRVGLTLRMGSEMTGWLYGRMKDVTVAVEPIDLKFNRIQIEASPVAAPGAIGFIKKSELKDNPKIDTRIRLGSNSFGYNEMINSPGSNLSGYDPVGNFEDFATFEPILKIRPGSKAQWVFSSGASANGYTATGGNACFEDRTKLLGIVTTNALIYSPSAPEFKDGFLNYKVAGLHFMEDGKSLFRGSYDLAIRASVARCVYGFTSAPIQATVSVVGADAVEQTIATEIVREDPKREWLFLSARNFTFSSPTIRVKITQAKAPTTIAAPIKENASQMITCIKGKVSKKISGINPKCPAGYKKR